MNGLKEETNGVIFISISENEVATLKLICNEIFGEDNFITSIIVQTGGTGGGKSKTNKPVRVKEYLLMYAKDINYFEYQTIFVKKKGRWGKDFSRFWDFETNEISMLKDVLVDKNIISENDSLPKLNVDDEEFKDFYLKYKDNIFSTNLYRDSPEKKESLKNKDKVLSFTRSNGETGYLYNGRLLYFLKNSIHKTPEGNDVLSTRLSDIWTDVTYNTIQTETDVPTFVRGQRPLKLMKRIINMVELNDEIVLDFFSGSSTTAHAVIDLNNEDNCNRKFIMVQLPESCNEKSEAFKQGYNNICEIGKERIRRAGDKINNRDIDVGFKVYKLRDKEGAK